MRCDICQEQPAMFDARDAVVCEECAVFFTSPDWLPEHGEERVYDEPDCRVAERVAVAAAEDRVARRLG